ncbi:MAG: hypothetical protein CM1200mP36_09610 [Gammaproteobacteria bacterium]|nr:MAG: hypothetical protein CM1200mP36_09610 [Gammaproteobacteria bacterium]
MPWRGCENVASSGYDARPRRCTTTPTAQDPVFLKLTDLEARLIRREKSHRQSEPDRVGDPVDQLQAETQALRGEIETLVFQTEGADSRQRELYVDVDTRLQALEEGQRQSSAVQLPPGALSGFPTDRRRPLAREWLAAIRIITRWPLTFCGRSLRGVHDSV